MCRLCRCAIQGAAEALSRDVPAVGTCRTGAASGYQGRYAPRSAGPVRRPTARDPSATGGRDDPQQPRGVRGQRRAEVVAEHAEVAVAPQIADPGRAGVTEAEVAPVRGD